MSATNSVFEVLRSKLSGNARPHPVADLGGGRRGHVSPLQRRFFFWGSAVNTVLVAPVTTASVERSNSALGYVKTKLRSRMGQQRLNDLILLFVHKEIRLDVGAVIDRFARKKPRRMTLLNAMTDSE